MNAALLNIIREYQSAVAEMFPALARHLGIPLPITNTDWANIGTPQRGATEDGIKYFIHGYGVRMDNGQVKVDFDLGDKGQINGFDAHRLKQFVKDNGISSPLSDEEKLDKEFETSVKSGELVYSGYILFYLDRSHSIKKFGHFIITIFSRLLFGWIRHVLKNSRRKK